MEMQQLSVSGGITRMNSDRWLVGTGGGVLKLPQAIHPPLTEASCFILEAELHTPHQLMVFVDFYTDEAPDAEPSASCRMAIMPGVRFVTYVELRHLDLQTHFLPRTPGRFKAAMKGRPTRPGDVVRVALRFPKHYTQLELSLYDIRFAEQVPDTEPRQARLLVDELGQLALREWDGKTVNEAELVSRLRKELEGVQATAPRTRGLSAYGGHQSLQFPATGFFRVERDERRWWLVDPDGCAFFSTGLDCVLPGAAGPVSGLEQLFEWLPQPEGAYSDAVRMDPDGMYVDFAVANLIRAFGESWWESWAKLTKRRMADWGFNTVANWSEPRFIAWSSMPYVTQLQNFPTTTRRIFRDFPDVFHPEYREATERYAAQAAAFRNDCRLIGYFMRNEPSWAFVDGFLPAKEMFRTQEPFASKLKLCDWLEERYAGDARAWCRTWGLELNEPQFAAAALLHYDQLSAQSDDDLLLFSRIMAEEYVKVPAETVRRVAPRHLNLGMRYAYISSELIFAGSQHYDVFSINCYKFRPKAEDMARIVEMTGKPIIIGEFHFGAPDRGMLACGLKGVRTQTDRGLAYRCFVEACASHPAIVGAHYFTLNDQPTSGRRDGEAYQIGLVDVCSKPYESFIHGIRQAHERLLKLLTGAALPVLEKPEELIRDGF